MSADAVRQILEQHLSDIWGVVTPIAKDNVDYTPVIGTPFIRTTLDGIYSDILSFRCQREYYQFTVQVLVPANTGSSDCFEKADLIAAGFINYVNGYLTCKTAVIERAAPEKNWFSCNVLIEVQYDHHF